MTDMTPARANLQHRRVAAPEGQIDLLEIARLLWRGKFWILFTSLFAAVLSIYYVFAIATPLYSAGAVVTLEKQQDSVVNLESVVTGLSGDQATINTEVEVMRSRALLEKLVIDMDLISDPEFNEELRPETLFSKDRLVELVQSILGLPVDQRPLTDQVILDQVVNKVSEALWVSNLRQSYVFWITVTTEDAEKSAQMANRLAELYIIDQLEAKFSATERASVWLAERVTDLQAQLEISEVAVEDFNARTDLINADTLAALNRQLKEQRDRLLAGEEDTNALQQRLALLEALMGAEPAEIAAAVDDRLLDRLLVQIENGRLTDRSSFDARFEQLIAQVQLEHDRASTRLVALTTSVADLSEEITRQSADLLELRQLQREAEASGLIYEHFLSRLKETSVQQGLQQADSRVLSLAAVPQEAAAPRKGMVVALSFLFGALFGMIVLVLREFSQNTFRVAEDLEGRTGHIVLGQIPSISVRKRRNVLQYLTKNPTSAAAEAIRNLRTSVLLSNVDNPPQVILSTSSVPGEGKTTQSIALAQNLAGLGKKVLLLEGDIRRRVFSEYFDIKGQKGFLSVMSGEATLAEAVAYNDVLKADILLGEKSLTNAADLYSSDRFMTFLKQLRAEYDYIIIDTPPVLSVPDARVIGRAVDSILYTVKWDSTSRRQVLEGLKAFENVNINVTGLVLSQVSPKGMKRYGYGDSYGAYNQNYG
ncbi:GumC family protein [Cochlodiniinecator piscidefendens]|uniref:GumC family protein n=1 Tax=Cochlodiniinecator piscidefendens TaxID=2715756 RepID=UPI001E48ECD6|nr:polysaccharide biosynthesis tyrosine autokinase [Cochlodiniinecator piscidefendens]